MLRLIDVFIRQDLSSGCLLCYLISKQHHRVKMLCFHLMTFGGALQKACTFNGSFSETRVPSTIQLPNNWRDFLHVNDNKAKLFNFWSQQIACSITDEGK